MSPDHCPSFRELYPDGFGSGSAVQIQRKGLPARRVSWRCRWKLVDPQVVYLKLKISLRRDRKAGDVRGSLVKIKHGFIETVIGLARVPHVILSQNPIPYAFDFCCRITIIRRMA